MANDLDVVSAGVDAGLTKAPVPSDEPAREIGPYRLREKVGEGGMGEVWIAEQRQPIRRTVAVKVIKAGMDTRQVVARFEAERQALAMMDHPAIAKVLDAGATDRGRPYFVMEYVKGEPITAYCDRHRLSITDRLALFIRVCEGVQHAHQKGIIHRDLKPSNVLVTILDGQPVPKIIDFGIAKAITQRLTGDTIYTELGGMLGTFEYMSPEQAEMTGVDIDTRTDIYSLGVLLYELVTGTLPFESKTVREKGLDEVRRAIRHVDPPRPSLRITQLGRGCAETAGNRLTEPPRLAHQLRGDLDWITMKALEKDRTRRYDTATGLANDLRRHLAHEPVAAGPPSTAYRAGKFVRRHRFGVAAALAVGLLLVSFSVTMTVQAKRIASERDRANREATAARQVSDFLVGLFRVADPGEARGRTITAREILSAGTSKVDRALRDQPEIQARIQTTIGTVYTDLGLYADAEPLLVRSVATHRRVRGDDDPATLDAIDALADLYWYQSRFPEAERLYRELVERSERTLGPEHQRTLKAQFDLASTYVGFNGRLDEAERLTRQVMEVQRRVLGETHPDTVASMNNLQSFYYRQKRFADALPIALEVLDATRRTSGENHPATLKSAHNVATLYDGLGRFDEAEPIYLRTITAEDRVLGDMHRDTCHTRERLAQMYIKERRYADAEPLFLKAWTGYARSLGSEHRATLGVVQELVALYKAWGNPVKVAEWEKRLTQSGLQVAGRVP